MSLRADSEGEGGGDLNEEWRRIVRKKIEDEAKVEAELAEFEGELKRKLPWQYEELDALEAIIFDRDGKFVFKLAAGALALALLLRLLFVLLLLLVVDLL